MQQHELLVNEIESTDGHLGTALRSVYEGPEPEKFFDCLDSRIMTHNKQIEQMCNHHYQGFIESVHSLLQVRSDVDKLKFEVEVANKELQLSGQTLIKKGGELVKERKTQQNIESSIDLLTYCLPVLETYGKLKKQMESKRYYPALKTLEQLEHTYLPRLSKFRFAQIMCDGIPKVRESIKEASMAELKDFLESIRKHSARIGEVAMIQAAKENGLDPNIISSRSQGDKKRKKRMAPTPPGAGMLEEDNDRHGEEDAGLMMRKRVQQDTPIDNEDGLSAQDLIDFAPVYRCMHIYSVLGSKDTFESYYRNQRRKQGRLALQPSVAMANTLACYKNYFFEMVGFFVVENHILKTTSGLINQGYIDEFWESALVKVIAVLRMHIGSCMDTQLLLQVKNLLMGYGYGTSQLFELLLEVRDQYSEILRKQWVDVFNSIFLTDNYTPMLVENKDQYAAVIESYPYKNPALEREPFPKRFPFSQFVPAIFTEVKRYISACLEFSEDLNISRTEIDDTIRKFANTLLTRTLGGCLAILIKKPYLTLPQLIQISINMEHLDQSCVYLEDFIRQLSGAHYDKNRVSRLHGQSMFKSAKSEAEEEIYKQIDLKVDEFFELASYDWTSTDHVIQPSGFIIDMVAFLNGIFQSFTNLPEKVAQTACMSACKHISESLMALLKDDDVKIVSENIFQQLSFDLKECENFAMGTRISGLDGNTFKMAFEELRQLLNLFITEEWTIYFADYGKPSHKYLRVQPAVCVKLLEKLKEGEKKKLNLFSSFKKNERDKKKFLDTILKQLRSLISEQQHL
ncbi:hypothetical protein HELRODRAFT_157969 [Helobdella robusta]|uniref:Exocyst complex component n=1 Tax=Helobdella robusta TaxID=6412 RepID=T1EMI3_HELRO|nr:hypothetical protein HELRODRAFT_157969 [Helobdella robusta]ESN92296.1 hypothetical protein HELRODRAFT_157969 [Helobdella robusta]